MIDAIKKLRDQKQLKKNLLSFLDETEKNLELFFVMDQRQFITQPFLLSAWEKVSGEDLVKKHEAICIYAADLREFNQAYAQYKEYEQWYVGDTNNKTPDNAKKLHAMKNDLDKRIKTMESLIIAAGQALEKEMITAGFLNYE